MRTKTPYRHALKDYAWSDVPQRFMPLLCMVAALIVANSSAGDHYRHFWQLQVGGSTIEHWINDGFMALFFLLLGLGVKRELYDGILADAKCARFAMVAALGSLAVPPVIFLGLAQERDAFGSIGVAMSTDIAFGFGVLALLGNRVPSSLRIIFTTTALAGNLLAIIGSTVFYAPEISVALLIAAIEVYFALLLMDGLLRVTALWPYLLGGGAIWLLTFMAGVHAAIAGTLLAFAIPYRSDAGNERSPASSVEQWLVLPVAFVIVPVFMLANAGLVISVELLAQLQVRGGPGIYWALVIGKPIGVVLVSMAAVWAGFCRLPPALSWSHVTGMGILGGIGLTTSRFIADLALVADAGALHAAAAAVIAASLTAGVVGYWWLYICARPKPTRWRRMGHS